MEPIVEVSILTCPLLPCPFCGTGPSRDEHAEQVQTYWHADNRRWSVLCEHCCVETSCRDDRVAAAELWNTRASPPTDLKADNAALVEVMKAAKIVSKFIGEYDTRIYASDPPVRMLRRCLDAYDALQATEPRP